MVKHRPFHSYTMKQAIQEGFILDVLQELHAGRQLLQARQDGRGRPGVRHQAGPEEAAPLRREPRPRHPAQGRDHGRPLPRAGDRARARSAAQARAMVVTSGIERAIQYYHAIRDYLAERKSPYQAIVAFSGEHEYGGVKVTEASLNGFPSNADRRPHRRRTRTASSSAPTSSRPATTSRCCTRCTWTRSSRASRPCRRSRASTGRTRRSTTSSCSTS